MANYGEYDEGSPHYWKQEGGSRESFKDQRDCGHRDADYGHSRDYDSGRHRSCDPERCRDSERSHDRERRHYRDRIRERDRSRENHRHRYDDEYDRERRHRHRTRSRSRGISRGRSRSLSRSHERRSKRTSGFDMAPAGAAVVPGATIPGQLSGVSPAMPMVMQGAFPFTGGEFGATFSGTPMQAMTQQAMRHARRVYVGGLPPFANEQAIATFFSQVMHAIGGNSSPGDAVVNVYINHEKKFAFVEMRTVEEASNAMALDGIMFEGLSVRVRRPSDYNPSLAAILGPSQPNPNLNLAAVGLMLGITGAAEGPDKIFVGGLPYYLTEIQIKELLESFGALRGFDLVKDRESGNSKGYAFCVYQDPSVTDIACAALNGLKMGDKTLTVRRATVGNQPKPDQANVFYEAQQQIALQKLVMQSNVPSLLPGMANGGLEEVPTKVLCLTELVSEDDLKDDQEYDDIYQDIKDECSRFGEVINLVIPRPSSTGATVPGVGKAFVGYTDMQSSAKARASLNGRKFGGNTVLAVYYSEDKFARGEYDC